MQTNPWYVESIEDFTFICCPECSYKSKTESKFQIHALENHPQCLVFFYEASDNNSTSTTKIYNDDSKGIGNNHKNSDVVVISSNRRTKLLIHSMARANLTLLF
jgi:hypothetical protein